MSFCQVTFGPVPILVKSQTGRLYFPTYEFLTSDFWSNLNFCQVTHRQKVMHKSPPCIRIGGLKKHIKIILHTQQGSNLRIKSAFPLEKLAKNLLVRTNLKFSELF